MRVLVTDGCSTITTTHLISLTMSRIRLKLVFRPFMSLHAAPMQKRVEPLALALRASLWIGRDE